MENDLNNYCTLYLVRHGEAVGNVEGMIIGQDDSPLTTNGIRQTKQISRKLRHINFAAVFSSDLIRAKRTAEFIIKKVTGIKTTQSPLNFQNV